MTRDPIALERDLAWDGCLNVRDLGGLPLAGGGTTRFGAVVRADAARQLSDQGWAAAVGYGVSRVIDLRYDSELAADPPGEVPVEVLHVPVLPDVDSSVWPEITAIARAEATAAGATQAVYLEWLERFRPAFARAVEAVGEAPAGTVVVHCQGGKDRTGLVTALLLRLVGVPTAAVAADYALTAERLAPRAAVWMAEAEDEAERRRRERISLTPAEAMAGVVGEVERRHGSARGYLEGGGAASEALNAVERRLGAGARA